MKTRRALVLYGLVVGTLALMLAWWVVFFVRQGDVLVARVNQSGAELSSAQALAVREAAQGSLRMFLYEGSFLFLAFVAGVVLMLRAMRREVLLSRAQQDFLSAVTHELCTPLASARLSIQSLALGRVGEDKRERYLKNADADLARLSQLVERVLETARLATSQPRVRLEPLDLAEFLRARAPALAAECAPALALELDAPLAAPVAADPAALETILRNLLANAAKYAAAAGRVQLCVTRNAREAQLVVRDFGSGVRGDPAKLFEPFVRGAGPLEKSQPGVGLGLYLVAELARAQGGRVSARNAPAGGFEVELALPCGASEPG
ncbi:MAG: HAMP domain-containing histidine kinase [Planctomycetes bacterium]|nr:HAMP domain-containing histidine kinase [Planctomycetota bacterium]